MADFLNNNERIELFFTAKEWEQLQNQAGDYEIVTEAINIVTSQYQEYYDELGKLPTASEIFNSVLETIWSF